MTLSSLSGLFFVVAAAALAPMIALGLRKRVPSVIFEILLGILIGPAVLALANPTGFVANLGSMGLALLMFLAGLEVDLREMRGSTLKRAGASWGLSVLLAGVVAGVLALTGQGEAALFVGIALSTTALGTLLPILRESGVFQTPLGKHVMAVGTLGEFGPIVLIALLLGERNAWAVALFLLGFAALVIGGLWLARNRRLGWLRHTIYEGLHATSQLPVRVTMLIIVFFVLVADDLGIDTLLGSFAAGLIVRAAIAADHAPADVGIYQGKIEAVGFGVLVPVFFVVSGMQIGIRSMIEHPSSCAVIPVIVVLMVLVRGIPTHFIYRGALPTAQRRSLVLFSATGLPLVVVVTQLGVQQGALQPQIAAAMVAGGLLSVVLLPLLGLRELRQELPAAASSSSPR
mgnify:FL=1